MKRPLLYTVVAVSGAAVLAVEILGTRVLGPFYGVGLFLWSALISVTLMALSLGYWLGGRWADRGPSATRMCVLLVVAGAWVFLVPILKDPALAATERWGLRAAVLATTIILFAPPLVFLGMVSPYAIKLRAHSLAEVGRSAGDLYAISTVASVVSALATGFYLIPHVGVSRLLFAIAAVLVATGVGGMVSARRPAAGSAVLVLLVAAGIVLAAALPGASADPQAGLLYIDQSPYAEIRVLDYHEGRYLLIDGGVHSIVDAGTWTSQFPYTDVIEIAKHLHHDAGSMLLVGLGAGSVAKDFARDGWKVDAVEIDPKVIDVARRFFGLEPGDATVYRMDGRRFLARRARPAAYDVIVMDAFGSSSIPFHLVTREAFSLARSRLRPGGTLVVNVEALGWHDPIVQAVGATLAGVFAHVRAFPIAEPPNRLGNVIIMATDTGFELDHPIERPLDRFSRQYNVAHAWDNAFDVTAADGATLTDDLNPVDVWEARTALRARQRLHEYFPDGYSW